MTTKRISETVQLAKKLVDRLPNEKADKLRILIQRAEEGHDTTMEIIDLLSSNENIRLWMRDQMDLQGGTRGYNPPPGSPSSIPASKVWICPMEECAESFPVIREGEDAPVCDVHKVTMIHGKKKG